MTWFLEDAALPSHVFGPQESLALAWLAAICASVAMTPTSFARGRAAGGQKSLQVVGGRENKDPGVAVVIGQLRRGKDLDRNVGLAL